MDDSADVAGQLVDRWLASSVVNRLAVDFDGNAEDVRAALVFLAGAHDVGKATPVFAVQHDRLAQQMRELGLYSLPKSELRRGLVHHSLAGHHVLAGWLRDRGWDVSNARSWGVVVGGHHGAPPDSTTEGASPDAYSELYGIGLWESVRGELLDRLATRTGVVERLERWRVGRLSAAFQVLATGFVIVADWIASNEDVLPYLTGELPEVVEAPNRVRQAMRELGLPEPWRPAGVPGDVGELFASRFKLPSGARPRPVQHAVCEVVRAMSEPGLMIVEAPMGEGKTEAALAAAELLAEKWGAGGVLVALPTQATSDAMFTRVVDWLDAMGASGQQVGGAITLGHGKARFNRLFQGLMRPGRMEIGKDQAGTTAGHVVAAHAWLSGRKKASLANFMVGTIDQLLFVGLKARHVMLRHLGLAGKVVVLDEVHAFDAYMNSYLTRVLTWLGAYGVPVVALSATLPTQRRRELLEAYRRGVRFGPDGSKLALPEISSAVEGDIGYPVLSWSQGTQVQTRAVEASGRRVEVDVELLDGGVEDDLDAVVGVLRDVLDGGGCAVVVRNTVRRVLATAERLVQEFPGEVTLAHARFMTSDRMRTDEDLLDRFGSPSRASGRPHRHIVVASQVIEQSLDVDFDVVITDLAPVDLVLQRLGRLHRHQRGEHQCERPEKLRAARAFITGLGVGGSEPELEPAASRYVYGAYPLLRSAAVLLPWFGDRIVLPDDIPTLVQQAYGDRDIGPESWHGVVAEARRVWRERTQDRRRKAGTFQIPEPGRPGRAIVGWLAADIGEADLDAQGQGQVRDGPPTLEAMLVIEGSDGRWRTPDWLPDGTGGCAIPRDDVPQDELARSLAACGLRLPLEFSSEQAETALWEATPPTWEYSPLIYRTPVLVIDENGRGELAGRRLRYTQNRGLEVFRDT